ncbi:MAG TPA: hypothetical protein VHI93_04900 [Candidatus Thermoplasmatota archaeon]|nr:hypothetical protein [Candidatus Thermoplasmatota archaeon]
MAGPSFLLPIRVACVALYLTGAALVVSRCRRDTPAAPPSSAPPAWDDRGLQVALAIVGTLIALAALFFGALVQLGVCYGGCSGWRKAVPLLMTAVPVGYAFASRAYLRARRRRAAADAAWAARAQTTSAKLAVVLSALLLAVAALVVTCFGLVGLGQGAP